MSAKSSILTFRRPMPNPASVRTGEDRRPTEAEREYVRARAREAARALFEAELRGALVAGGEVDSCE